MARPKLSRLTVADLIAQIDERPEATPAFVRAALRELDPSAAVVEIEPSETPGEFHASMILGAGLALRIGPEPTETGTSGSKILPKLPDEDSAEGAK